MILQLIQWGIISLILIFLVHYLYSFFRDILTVPKTRDLVNRPIDAYKEMYQVINETVSHNNSNKERTTNNVGNDSKQSSMKDELKSYLSGLNSSNSNNSTNLNSISSNNHNNNNTNTQEQQLDFAGSSSSQFGFAL